MTIKEDLHHLVDELDEATASEALVYLSPILREAPLDDEPEPDAERAAVAEARAELEVGRVVSHEEIRREFGIL